MLLCDVSGSMMQFSEFVLRFMKALSDSVDSARIFLFSEEVREIDAFALQDMDNFRNLVRHSGIFGRGTDLGSALDALCHLRPAPLGPSTVLLILSDAKTVDLEPRGPGPALASSGPARWCSSTPSPPASGPTSRAAGPSRP